MKCLSLERSIGFDAFLRIAFKNNIHIYVHRTINGEKEDTNLKDSKERFPRKFGGREVKGTIMALFYNLKKIKEIILTDSRMGLDGCSRKRS